MGLEKTFHAVVTDIRLESRIDGTPRWQVALDSTEFSPEQQSGSLLAVSPSGARLEIFLLRVVQDAATTWHIVGKPLAPGTEVVGHVLAGN